MINYSLINVAMTRAACGNPTRARMRLWAPSTPAGPAATGAAGGVLPSALVAAGPAGVAWASVGNEKTRSSPPPPFSPGDFVAAPMSPSPHPRCRSHTRSAHPGAGEGIRSSGASPISMGPLRYPPPASSFRCRPLPAQTFNEHCSPQGYPHSGGRWGGARRDAEHRGAPRRCGPGLIPALTSGGSPLGSGPPRPPASLPPFPPRSAVP